jgi:hypothetical protein
MHCTKCGTESTPGRKFCTACGSLLSSRCPKCGAENAPSSAFCGDCGAALESRAASAATSSPQVAVATSRNLVIPEQPDASTTPEGERKIVTALFADLKGSTQLMEDLDPERACPRLHSDQSGCRGSMGHRHSSTAGALWRPVLHSLPRDLRHDRRPARRTARILGEPLKMADRIVSP